MSFLFFILFLVIFIGIAVLLSILGVVRNILGLGRRKNPSPDNNPGERQSAYNTRKQPNKVFADNEGEYVDYEEIKDK